MLEPTERPPHPGGSRVAKRANDDETLESRTKRPSLAGRRSHTNELRSGGNMAVEDATSLVANTGNRVKERELKTTLELIETLPAELRAKIYTSAVDIVRTSFHQMPFGDSMRYGVVQTNLDDIYAHTGDFQAVYAARRVWPGLEFSLDMDQKTDDVHEPASLKNQSDLNNNVPETLRRMRSALGLVIALAFEANARVPLDAAPDVVWECLRPLSHYAHYALEARTPRSYGTTSYRWLDTAQLREYVEHAVHALRSRAAVHISLRLPLWNFHISHSADILKDTLDDLGYFANNDKLSVHLECIFHPGAEWQKELFPALLVSNIGNITVSQK
jgi:hypothetical protein